MKITRQIWFWLMCIAVILLLGLVCFLAIIWKPFTSIISSGILWTIIGIITSIVVSATTHHAILKRDKKINTIRELGLIRNAYPTMRKKGASEKVAYLRAMEFFCLGVLEDVFDLEIVIKMSGHFLKKQYQEYMRDFAFSKRINGHEYEHYICVMDIISHKINQYENKSLCMIEEDNI